MGVEKIDVGAYLLSAAGGRTIDWVLNPGNAGDSLIVAGTSAMLGRSGVPHRVVWDYAGYDSVGRILCYSGGGNLVRYYRFARDFLARHVDVADRVILLPHTVDANRDFLAGLGRNVTLICREAISYDHCRSAAPKAEVFAADDLAFALDPHHFLRQQSAGRDPNAVERLESRFQAFIAETEGDKVLNAWRGDAESSDKRPVGAHQDISNDFGIESAFGLSAMLTSADYLLRAINRFDLIRTDRLHTGIAGALLGKQVEIYPNSYYKNAAVYDFSLAHFPGVRFVEWPNTPSQCGLRPS